MIWRQRRGQIEAARARRAIIKLPKYTSSVEGTLALQLLGGESSQRDEVSRLLAREYVIWQIPARGKKQTRYPASCGKAGQRRPL